LPDIRGHAAGLFRVVRRKIGWFSGGPP